MKNIGNIIKLTLLIPAALLIASCSKDHRGGGETPGTNGEKEVEMSFLTPGGTLSRAAIPAEDVLHDITLLVFDGQSDNSKFLYSRYAWKTSTTGNSFKTTLRLGSGLTIYFAANAKDIIQTLEGQGDLVGGVTTWGVVRELLLLETPTGFDLANKGLPMWGHKFDIQIADQPNNSLGRVNLTRSVASTDVQVLSSEFTLEKGHLAYAANKGYLAYTLLSNGTISAPVSPANMATSVDWSTTATGNKIENYFYMYDNDTDLTPTGTNRPTKLILEGKWTGAGGSGQTTFYPISFRNLNQATGEYDKKQVTRNNKYLIVVKNVHGDGWGSIEEAKDADDVNVDYDVIDWDENGDGDIMIDGPKYLYRGASEVKLGHLQNSTEEVVFRTNFDLSDFTMKFGTTGTEGTTSAVNDRFKAEIVTVNAGQADEYTCFRFTALKDYGADADNPSTLYVKVGRLTFKFTVTQDERKPGNWDDEGNQDVDF